MLPWNTFVFYIAELPETIGPQVGACCVFTVPHIVGLVFYELVSGILACMSVSQGLGTCCSGQNLGTLLDSFILRRDLL